MKPRVFISYSWSSPGHQDRIRQWSEQLMSDGVEVVLDIWDLKEGDDKYAFMESMVTDSAVTHVLIFSDLDYATKADARKDGVGTESQIISSKIYSKAQQSKFIPIVCEFDEAGEPCLPTFLSSRIWIDFSSPESANENWERLVRVLHGKPAHEKPVLGKPPIYITTDAAVPASPVSAKFITLKQAILQNRHGLRQYRQDFLDSCYRYADELRVRVRPEGANWGERVLTDCGKLKPVRDHLVDWVLLESDGNSTDEFADALIATLESLLELSSRPSGINSWQESWFDAHRVFVYETFLYIVAALMRTESFEILNIVFTSHYLRPQSEDRESNHFTAIPRT